MRWAGLVLACVAFALVGAAPGRASFPAQHQRLIFTAEGAFGMDAFAVDSAGGLPLVLATVNEAGIDGAVSVAPSGTELAYTQTLSGIPPLSQIPPRLRSRFAQPGYPILSYAGIDLQTSFSGDFSFAVPRSQAIAAYSRPAWSPDGKQLVISSGQPGNLHLFVIPAGTSYPTLVTAPPGDCLDARWSPDGTSIVFTLRNGGSSQLYLVHPDRSGTWQLYVVPTAGGAPTRLVDDPGNDTRPAWSPDGSLIAYSSDRAEHDEIYVVRPNGQGERRLVSMPGNAYVQDWQPLPHTDRPVVRAYPSTGRRGGPVVLRYSAWSTVPLTVEFSFEASTASSGASGSAAPFKLADFRLRGVRLYRVESSDAITLRGRVPSHFTFCVAAHDAWGNQASGCSTYRTPA